MRAFLASVSRLLARLTPHAPAFCVGVIGVWLLAMGGGLGWSGDIAVRRAASDGGQAVFVTLPVRLLAPADDHASGWLPRARLFENGVGIGPGREMHEAIRRQGGGRFALDGRILRFSATDGSDPRANGRRYALSAAARPTLWLHGLAALALAALLAAGWRSRMVRIAAGPPAATVAAIAAGPLAVMLLTFLSSRALVLPRGEAVALVALAAAASVAPWRPILAWIAARLELARGRLAGLMRGEGAGAAPLVGLFAAGWTASLWFSAGSNPNYSDTIAPALWRVGELILHPGTIQLELYPHLQVLLPRLAAFLQTRLGLPVVGLHDALGLAFTAAGLSAVGIAAARLARLPGWPGALIGCAAIAALAQGGSASSISGTACCCTCLAMFSASGDWPRCWSRRPGGCSRPGRRPRRSPPSPSPGSSSTSTAPTA